MADHSPAQFNHVKLMPRRLKAAMLTLVGEEVEPLRHCGDAIGYVRKLSRIAMQAAQHSQKFKCDVHPLLELVVEL